jgi:hypothetical protein
VSAAASSSLLALKAAWQWRANGRSRRSAWLVPASGLLLLGLPVLAAFWWVPPWLAGVLLALLGAAELLLLWGHQFAALLRLDHPHFARLLPGHGATLRRAAVALWAALVGVCAVVAAIVAFGLGAGIGEASRAAQLTALGAGGTLLFVALALRWWWLWVLIWLLAFRSLVPAPLRELVHSAALLAREPWLAAPWLATLLGLAAMAVVLVSIFGRGDAAHARSYAARENMRRIFEAGSVGQKPTLAAYGRWGEWLGRPWQRMADAWQAHLTAHANPSPASVLARADLVLYGAQHWLRQVGVLAPLLLLLGLGWAAAVFLGGVDVRLLLSNAAFGAGIGLVCMLLGMATGWPGALWTSRREQALLMLLPGMPQGAALNRALAWRSARSYLLMWLALLPIFGAVAWVGGALHALAMPAVALPMVAWLWRDPSHLRAPTPAGTALPFFVCLILGAGSAAVLREYPALLGPWLAVLVLISLPAVAWRWRRVSARPQALPAGRLA